MDQTAAEIISARANANRPNMGLTSWQGSIVRRGDIVVAKNYLLENEIDTLNRLVTLLTRRFYVIFSLLLLAVYD